MEGLLPTSDAQRNYLPQDWAEMLKVLDGTSGSYRGLTAAVASPGILLRRSPSTASSSTPARPSG
jgi:hypothetical protein